MKAREARFPDGGRRRRTSTPQHRPPCQLRTSNWLLKSLDSRTQFTNRPACHRLPGHLLRQSFLGRRGPGSVAGAVASSRELWAGRGAPGWSALGFWLSVVVMVAVAGVLDVSFKRRNWLSRLLDVAEQEIDSAGCRGHRVVDQRLALGTAQRSDRSVVVGEVQVGDAPLGCGAAVLLGTVSYTHLRAHET